MSEVTYKKLSDVTIPPISGKRPSGGVNTETEGVPSLGGENILLGGGLTYDVIKRIPLSFYQSMPKGKLKKLDVLINKDGAQTGKVGLYKGKFKEAAINEHLFIIRPIENSVINPTYLYYSLLLPETQLKIERRITGSAQPGLNSAFVKSVDIPFHVIKKQKKIKDILETIDQSIEKTEALIHKYQQIKAGLMHDLFTRGVTADGKLRLPSEQAPELYQEAPIGWIPKEWHLVRASDICHPITKGTTPSNFINNSSKRDSIPYIRVENLSFNGSLQFDKDSLFVSKIIHNFELARSRVFVGDILMNIVGPPLGKVSLITDGYEEWNTNQAVAIFRVLHQRYRTYLLYYLLSDFAQKWFYLRSKQTSGQVNLTLEMCSNLEIPLPKNEAELTSISNTLARIFDKINTENTFRKKLLKKKSGLMHDLLTGKVPVKIDQEETAHV